MTTAMQEDPRDAGARAEAAKDAVAICRLVTTGRLDDATAYIATMDAPELAQLIVCMGGLACTLGSGTRQGADAPR
jgi:hypothetical protein